MHTQYTSNKQYIGTLTRHIHTHNPHNIYVHNICGHTHSTHEHTTCMDTYKTYTHPINKDIYNTHPHKQYRCTQATQHTCTPAVHMTHIHTQYTYILTIHMHTHKPHAHSQYLCSHSTHTHIHIHTQSHGHTLTSGDRGDDRWTCGGVYIFGYRQGLAGELTAYWYKIWYYLISVKAAIFSGSIISWNLGGMRK